MNFKSWRGIIPTSKKFIGILIEGRKETVSENGQAYKLLIIISPLHIFEYRGQPEG